MNKPTHIAYVVNKRKGDEDKKDWRRVGDLGGYYCDAMIDALARRVSAKIIGAS